MVLEAQWLVGGAWLTVIGVALGLFIDESIAAPTVLAGVAGLGWGLHRFGRSGPDEAV